MLQQRKPSLVERILGELDTNGGDSVALHQLHNSAMELRNLGVEIPSWQQLSEGKRPPPQSVPDQSPGCFPIKGWQRWGCYLLDEAFRGSIWDQFSGTEQAHIRSQGARGVG